METNEEINQQMNDLNEQDADCQTNNIIIQSSENNNNEDSIQKNQQLNQKDNDQTQNQILDDASDENLNLENLGLQQLQHKISNMKDAQQINNIEDIQNQLDEHFENVYQNPEAHNFLENIYQEIDDIQQQFQNDLNLLKQEDIKDQKSDLDSFEQQLQADIQDIDNNQIDNINQNFDLDNSNLNKLEASLQQQTIEDSINTTEVNNNTTNNNQQNINKSQNQSQSQSAMFTGKSAKPSSYIPQAIKDKLDILILNMHKELKVLSHQKLVLVWVAVRVFTDKHVEFWRELIQSYGGHIHLKRYGSSNAHQQFQQDLQNGKFNLNPIILMTSGFCGEKLVPKIYSHYRFKGIIVYTDKTGLSLNEKWVKKYPRIVMLTDDKEKAKNMLHNLINNTLFRGAVKFKDLDHFLGKKKLVQDYILPDEDDQTELNSLNGSKQDLQHKISEKSQEEEEEEKQQDNQQQQQQQQQKKNQIQSKQEEVLTKEQQQQIQNMKPYERKKYYESLKKTNNKSKKQIHQDNIKQEYINQLQANFTWSHKQKKYIPKNNNQNQNIKRPWDSSFINNKEKRFAIKQYYKTRTPNEVGIVEEDFKIEPGAYTIKTFHGIKISEDYHFQNLLKCKSIVEKNKVLIRVDMLEQNVLKTMAKLYCECFNVSDSPDNLKQYSQDGVTLNLDDNTLSFEKDELEYEIAVNILKLYTKNETDFYALINCALNTLNEDLIYQLQTIITSLRFSHNLYDDTHDTVFKEGEVINLWRGCTFDREYFSGFFRKREHIVFPAFTSTSTDIDQAKKYAMSGTEKRIIFQIQCVCDDKMMQIRPKNLKSISKYPEESEYLMNCFSLLYIEDIDYDWEGGYLLYKLKLLR